MGDKVKQLEEQVNNWKTEHSRLFSEHSVNMSKLREHTENEKFQSEIIKQLQSKEFMHKETIKELHIGDKKVHFFSLMNNLGCQFSHKPCVIVRIKDKAVFIARIKLIVYLEFGLILSKA